MPSAKVRIALVDDDRAFLEKMKGYAGQAAEEEKVDCIVETFSDSVAFLDGFSAVYDVIFLDIEMPGTDGLETARRIRKVDESVSLIFVTNMAQYAINGYEVNALDFIVKPVEYYTFLDKFRKALRFQSTRREKTALREGEDGIVRVPFSEIYYLEKDKNKNYIIYLPLEKGSSVTPFGYRYVSPVYGGTGSGNVNTDSDQIVTASGALHEYFNVNEAMEDALNSGDARGMNAEGYERGNEEGGFEGAGIDIIEYEPSVYDGREESCQGTTGIVFIGRVGGEGSDVQADVEGSAIYGTGYVDGTAHQLQCQCT